MDDSYSLQLVKSEGTSVQIRCKRHHNRARDGASRSKKILFVDREGNALTLIKTFNDKTYSLVCNAERGTG